MNVMVSEAGLDGTTSATHSGFQRDVLRTWDSPCPDAADALRQWAAGMPVVFAGPEVAVPVVSMARLTGPNEVRLMSTAFPELVSGIEFPPNVLTAWVAGGLLKTDNSLYLMPATPVGSGGMYDIYRSIRLPNGDDCTLRMPKRSTSPHVIDRDLNVLAYAHRRNLPGVPFLERQETMADGTRVFVIKEPRDARSAYRFVVPEKLSPDNLFRLVELQLFELKAWLNAGLEYADWQEEELVRVKQFQGDVDNFYIVGHRQLDFQPVPALPSFHGTINSTVEYIQLISDSLISPEQIAQAEPILFAYEKALVEMNAQREEAHRQIPYDELQRQAEKRVEADYGVFFRLARKRTIESKVNNVKYQLIQEAIEERDRRIAEFNLKNPDELKRVNDLKARADEHRHGITSRPRGAHESNSDLIEHAKKATSDAGRHALINEIIQQFGPDSPLAVFIEIECPEIMINPTDSIIGIEQALRQAKDRLNAFREHLNALEIPIVHNSKMSVSTFIEFRVRPLVKRVADTKLREGILSYLNSLENDSTPTDACMERLETMLTHVGQALGVSRLQCGQTEYDAVFLTEEIN